MTADSRRHRLPIHLPWLLAGLAALVVCVSPVAAQQDAATPWTQPSQPADANQFQFAVVSDKAANPREGVFEAALAKLELLRPEFVLCVGDLIHGYGDQMKPLEDEDVVREKRREFDESLKGLTVPFYRVSGNHDINNDLSAGIWKELYGPDYYSFVYKDVLFLCLNSQDGPNHKTGIGPAQIAWTKDTLAKHGDARWVCVFFHQPLWLEDEKRIERAKASGRAAELTGFGEIEKLLEGQRHTVFAGHHHRYVKLVKNGTKYFKLATTGGQSGLAGPEAGQFDHIMWITMTDEGPIICNLMLDGILDEDAKRNMPE